MVDSYKEVSLLPLFDAYEVEELLSLSDVYKEVI